MERHYALMVLVLGVAFMAAAVLPPMLRRVPLSLPMIYVGVGMLLPVFWPDSPRADPLVQGALTERLSELAVIVSLMGAGLKLERPVGWKSWGLTWRLLGVTMPLCIVALALGGWYVMGLTLAGAVMLGAVMAPTDPVLASSVQVSRPGVKNTSETRFALTSEAGLNDGLAFPFVNLAILLAGASVTAGGVAGWLAVDVVWKIVAGVGMGVLVGRGMAWFVFGYVRPGMVVDGFVALAIMLVAYGTTELIHGYGFIAVFVAALVFRTQEQDHELHGTLHDFVDQVERLLMAGLLMFFGAAITHGLFDALTWQGALVGVLFLFVVRPIAGMVGLLGTGLDLRERFAISGLGIRGIGTFYYLAHGLKETDILDYDARELWATAGLIVLVSVVLHGTTAGYAMRAVHGEGEGEEDEK